MRHQLAAAFAAATALSAPRALMAFGPRADADPGQILAEINRTFAEFKEKNDKRLADLEARGSSDVVTTEQVDKINAEIDRLSTLLAALQLSGPGAGADKAKTPEGRAYSGAFATWFRRGKEPESLHELAVKAQMTVGSDPDGGYMAPFEMEAAIDRVLMTVSAMRGLATVMPISAATYKKLFSLGGAQSGWVGESEARGATATPTLSEMEFVPGEIYANPFASQTLLDDAYVDLAAWLAGEVSITFAEQEGAAFITGDGVKKPRGLTSYGTAEDAAWKWGKLGYKVSGDATHIASPDCLITLTQTLRQGYRNNATFMTNRFTVGVIRELKDGTGRYMWQPPIALGQPASLLGYPLADDDNMPDIGAGTFPVAFGDFRRGYLIVDRAGVRVLRDPYTNKPFVGFYTTKRVGGGVQNFEAIKLLKISA